MAIFDKISFQWLPIYDNYRYRPLPVSVDFLQNGLDIVFLLFFIWYWNWGPLLVVLYYSVETLVISLFTAVKWWKSNVRLSESTMAPTPAFKFIACASLCVVVGVFSYGQVLAVHDALSLPMTLPSWEIIVADEQQFMIGVLAIVLQQGAEYYKFTLQSKHVKPALVNIVCTPIFRIFVLQFTIMLGIFALLMFSFADLKWASVMIALVLGVVKLIAGQLQVVIKK